MVRRPEQPVFLKKRSTPAPFWPNAAIAQIYKCRNVPSCYVGILCGTIAGKKKKKMMYLTAKNAGQKTLHAAHFYPDISCSFFCHWLTIAPVFKQSLTDMSCRSMKKWQRCRHSRERHWFWSVLRAWADAAWRTDWWSSIPRALAPLYRVRHAWFLSVFLNSVTP